MTERNKKIESDSIYKPKSVQVELPKGYDNYKLTRSPKVDIESDKLKGELSNIKDRLWNTPSIDDIADNLGSKLGLGKISEEYESFMYGAKKVKAYRDEGYSLPKAALKTLDDLLPLIAKTDNSEPILNQILNEIPIINAFTKKKYSLANNKITYAHEASNTDIAYTVDILGRRKVQGLYYNAKYYANHNIPPEDVEGIIRKLSGDPSMSAPHKSVIAETRRQKRLVRVNGELKEIFVNAEYQKKDEVLGVGLGLSSHVNIGTRKRQKFDPSTKKYTNDFIVKTTSENMNLESQMGKGAVGAFKGNSHGFGAPYHSADLEKDPQKFPLYHKQWQHNLTTTAIQISDKGVSHLRGISGFSYVNPVKDYDSLLELEPFTSVGEYIAYQETLANKIKQDSKEVVGKDDIRYGQLPYNWHQVFSEFELSSTGNWNVSFCEFDKKSKASLFVPDGRPTYGPWSYMPIMSYDFVKSELASTSVEVSQNIAIMIPSYSNEINTLQVVFLDDRYDRIYTWFRRYSENIFGFYDGFVKPYKNCCLKCTIDILDWDRTILRRQKLAVVPVNFTQHENGDSSDNFKTVNVLFSVVGSVYDETAPKSMYDVRPVLNRAVGPSKMNSINTEQ